MSSADQSPVDRVSRWKLRRKLSDTACGVSYVNSQERKFEFAEFDLKSNARKFFSGKSDFQAEISKCSALALVFYIWPVTHTTRLRCIKTYIYLRARTHAYARVCVCVCVCITRNMIVSPSRLSARLDINKKREELRNRGAPDCRCRAIISGLLHSLLLINELLARFYCRESCEIFPLYSRARAS